LLDYLLTRLDELGVFTEGKKSCNRYIGGSKPRISKTIVGFLKSNNLFPLVKKAIELG
jgi:hypothetical protein